MAWPTSLQVALKEWAVVCDALKDGKQIVLLRKGGILESIGGFDLEHRQFLFFPTYLHQNAEMLKADAKQGLEKHDAEPSEVVVTAAGVVSDIVQLKSREQMDAIEDEHIWTKPLIDMRFNYRPMNPLYLLIIRAYRLRHPLTLANTPAYAGCKSWVPLDHPFETGDNIAALDDVLFEHRRNSILERLAE